MSKNTCASAAASSVGNLLRHDPPSACHAAFLSNRIPAAKKVTKGGGRSGACAAAARMRLASRNSSPPLVGISLHHLSTFATNVSLLCKRLPVFLRALLAVSHHECTSARVRPIFPSPRFCSALPFALHI